MRMEENDLVVAFEDFQNVTTVVDMGALRFLLNPGSSLSGLVLPELDDVTLRLMQIAGVVLGPNAAMNGPIESEAKRLIPSTVTVTVDFK